MNCENYQVLISDLVDGIVRLMNAEADDIHMPVNLGNPGGFWEKPTDYKGHAVYKVRENYNQVCACHPCPPVKKAK